MAGAADHLPCWQAAARATRRARRPRMLGRAGLLVAFATSTGLSALPAAAATTSGARSATGPAAGTIFVANPGEDGNGSGGTGPGSVTFYRPGASGNVHPEAVLTKGIDGPNSITFDSSGDLWVANDLANQPGSSGFGTIVEYSRAGLAEASPVPSVTISFQAGGLAFDPSGNLWATGTSGTVVEFSKSQLAKSGAPNPVVTLSTSLCSPTFDAAGDLWLGSGGDSLSELAKAQLTKSGSPTPRVTIMWAQLVSPCKPTFDRSGNLWVASYGTTNAVEFTKAQLTRSATQTPKVVISSSVLLSSGDVAVDSEGDLWVPDAGNNAVVEFKKSQLARSGSPAPALTIAGPATGLNWPWAVAIEP